jgi:hypothetical protein
MTDDAQLREHDVQASHAASGAIVQIPPRFGKTSVGQLSFTQPTLAF